MQILDLHNVSDCLVTILLRTNKCNSNAPFIDEVKSTVGMHTIVTVRAPAAYSIRSLRPIKCNN